MNVDRDLLIGAGALAAATAIMVLLTRRAAAATATAPNSTSAPRVRPLPPAPPAPGWERWAGAHPEPRGFPENTILAVQGIDAVSPEARRALLDLCDELDMPVDSIAAVIASESGWKPWNAFGLQKEKGTARPLKGPDGAYLLTKENQDRVTAGRKPFFAVGLVQLTNGANLPGFATNEELLKVLEWSAEEQMDRVVRPLYLRHGAAVKGADPGRVYMTNFLPKFAGKPAEYVLGDKSSDDPKVVKRYDMNKGFDGNGDSRITVEEVTASARRACAAAKGRRIGLDGTIYEPAGLQTAPVDAAATKAPTAPKTPAQPAPAPAADRPDTQAPPAASSAAVAPKGSTSSMLLEAVRSGSHEQPTWVEVPWRGLRVRVGAHCLRAPVKLGTGETRLLRLGVSWKNTLEICRLLGWTPPSADLVDAIHAAAELKLEPKTFPAQGMTTLDTNIKHNAAVDKQIPADQWEKLADPEGKNWIWSPRLRVPPNDAVTYGWHCTGKPCGNGKPLWQTLGPDTKTGQHDKNHYDYSQTLRPIDRSAIAADGSRVDVLDELEKAGLPASVTALLR